MTVRNALLGAVAAATAVVLTACGAQDTPAANDGTIKVVASTNVWGSVVKAVGGDEVEVNAIIDDPSGDPHSYESKPADLAAVRDAQARHLQRRRLRRLLRHAARRRDGRRQEDRGVPGVRQGLRARGARDVRRAGARRRRGPRPRRQRARLVRLRDRRARSPTRPPPTSARSSRPRRRPSSANAKDFTRQARPRWSSASRARARARRSWRPSRWRTTCSTPRASRTSRPRRSARPWRTRPTSPPPRSPTSPGLIEQKQVAALVNNAQTENAGTQQVVDQAKAAGVPIVEVTETLPEGVTGYLDWMTKQVDSLAGALGA